jgi:succinoglycan biosynthesis protein ExoA
MQTETSSEGNEVTSSNGATTVSVVIPCYNEDRFIGKALESLLDQYESELYEIIIVDGLSIDQTRTRITSFATTHPQVTIKIIDNPAKNIPTGLNLGVKHARGEIIARMDAHAVPPRGYIRHCVEVLAQKGVGVVGMPCFVRPGNSTLIARAIASAVSHPFGIGDAKYRLMEGQLAQEQVDTVAFACFKKSLWTQLGGFNEELLTNEDYDFNYRVRRLGQHVILDRRGRCDYFARPTLSGLSEQYRRYGHWKAQMVKLHPGSIRLRHLVAPSFIVSVLLLALVGVFLRIAWLALALELMLYLVLSLGFALQVARKNDAGIPMVLLMPLVFLTIHWSWGTSFVLGLLRGLPKQATVG